MTGPADSIQLASHPVEKELKNTFNYEKFPHKIMLKVSKFLTSIKVKKIPSKRGDSALKNYYYFINRLLPVVILLSAINIQGMMTW